MEYCDRCMRSFPHYRALEQHKDNSSFHNICYNCNLDFESNGALTEHYRLSPEHYYCDACHMLFNSFSDLRKHGHSVHNYCTECGWYLQNQNNLQQHLNSKIHRPSNIACRGRGCNRSFISAAALALHFESGTCRSGMTRDELNRLVVQADKNNYITDPRRLIGAPQGGYEAPMRTASWATERSWNGLAFECFLCHSTYNTLNQLNQHLRSPAHDRKIYRCPKSGCHVEYATLSALCQHVENGSCGVKMFRQVQNAMESLTRGFNTITL